MENRSLITCFFTLAKRKSFSLCSLHQNFRTFAADLREWRIMEVGEKMTKAPYLNEIHQVIDGIDVFDYLGEEEINKLHILSSTLKQKWD